MAENLKPPPSLFDRNAMRHVVCPKCNSPKAVLAASHYTQVMCFCPLCEHAWEAPADCAERLSGRV